MTRDEIPQQARIFIETYKRKKTQSKKKRQKIELRCVREKLLAEVQTFCKTQDFVTFFAAKCKQVQQLGGFYSEMALSI